MENLVGDLGSTAEIPGDDGAVGRVPARGVGAAQKLGAFLEEEDVQGLLHGRLVAPHHLQKQTRVLRAGPRGTGRHPRGGPPGAQRTGFGEAGAEGRDCTRPRTPEGRRWCPAVWGRTWERRRLLKPARHARSRRPSRLPPEESLRRWEWASLETAEPAPTRGPSVQAFSLLAPWPTCQSLPPRGPPGSVTRHVWLRGLQRVFPGRPRLRDAWPGGSRYRGRDPETGTNQRLHLTNSRRPDILSGRPGHSTAAGSEPS